MIPTNPKGKILVVDDQEGWRELLVDILTDDGHEVETASNLQSAINLLSNKEKIFDVAILDMRLVDSSPYNIDGMKVLKEAKTLHPSIKAIILSGYPDAMQREKVINFYRADGYYEKVPDGNPLDIDEFRQTIVSLLSTKNQSPAAG